MMADGYSCRRSFSLRIVQRWMLLAVVLLTAPLSHAFQQVSIIPNQHAASTSVSTIRLGTSNDAVLPTLGSPRLFTLKASSSSSVHGDEDKETNRSRGILGRTWQSLRKGCARVTRRMVAKKRHWKRWGATLAMSLFLLTSSVHLSTTTTTAALPSPTVPLQEVVVASTSEAVPLTKQTATVLTPRGGGNSRGGAGSHNNGSGGHKKKRGGNAGNNKHNAKSTLPDLPTKFRTKTPLSSLLGKKRDVDLEESAVLKLESKVEAGVATAGRTTTKTLTDAAMDLTEYMRGPKSDSLWLLLATALITPLCKQLNLSPILGFLASGMLLGPNGCGIITGIHTTETLAELGIVFFLFEMGIELSLERLQSMRKDVFGLGLSQFCVTAVAIAMVGKLVGQPANAVVVLGGGLALSSSAFVLQLLKDKNQLATRFGKAAFGILLFQDLAVVPLLVVTPILAGGGNKSLGAALGSALVKAGLALSSIAFAGRVLLNPLFKTVAQAQSQEAFLGVILLTVLSMSFMTEGLGLSNTLGAFLAGVLLSETKYRYQVEADIAPFRGILLGFFFVTVGFEINLKTIASNFPLVSSIVMGIILIKALITTALSLAFGLSLSTSQQTGLILSQGGEFAFVTFGLARSLGILDAKTTELMLTSVSLTMALTPLMAALGSRIAKQLEEQSDFTHYLGQDRDANEIKESDDFVVVVGYGVVGRVVCDLLDRKLIKYVGLEIDPNKAIEARNSGLPVFYGDIARQEVADAFNVGKASAVVVCIAEKAEATRAVIALRRFYPDVKIFARAADTDHASRLQNTLNVAAMVPILPEDNLLLTLPFGNAVMKALGVPPEEANAITEAKRKEVLSGRGLDLNEEEAALVQLGITPPEVEVVDTVVSEVETEDEKEDAWDAAAAERREEAMEKSPFVAKVIEEVCPGSVHEEDEEAVVDGIILEQEVDGPAATIAQPDFVDTNDDMETELDEEWASEVEDKEQSFQ